MRYNSLTVVGFLLLFFFFLILIILHLLPLKGSIGLSDKFPRFPLQTVHQDQHQNGGVSLSGVEGGGGGGRGSGDGIGDGELEPPLRTYASSYPAMELAGDPGGGLTAPSYPPLSGNSLSLSKILGLHSFFYKNLV